MAAVLGPQVVLSNNMVLTLLSDSGAKIVASSREVKILTQEDAAKSDIQNSLHFTGDAKLQSLIEKNSYSIGRLFSESKLLKITDPRPLSIINRSEINDSSYNIEFLYKAEKDGHPGYLS